jgi:hypothetical protein
MSKDEKDKLDTAAEVGVPTPPPPPPPPPAMSKDEKDKLDATTAVGIPPAPPPPPAVKKALPRSATMPNLTNVEDQQGRDGLLSDIRKGKTLKRADSQPDLRASLKKGGKADIFSETEKRIEEARKQMELRRPVSSHPDDDDDGDDWD